MSYAESHNIRTANGIAFSADTIRRIRLSMAAILVLAVFALGALGGRSDIQAPDRSASQNTEQHDTDSEPVFDGRGKWTGYAR